MENTKNLKTWLTALNLNHPLVIAGPCSAETEEQVLSIAHDLKNTDVSYFRAGVWKPRTRPGGFEGVGAPALKWLQQVKKETGLKVATEVANAVHVRLALEHDIDLLWIGARSTVSPFIIQEIADSLKGTDKTVLIKNPVNPDLSLWLGAVERIYNADIKNIGVIHRGFSTYEKTKYRNIPEWQMAIDLKDRFPDLPILCDPSHIGGKRDLIFEISQTALDLSYEGLIIETHCNPDKAWSDAAQQITPSALLKLMKDLKVRDTCTPGDSYKKDLDKFRAQIDILDNQIIDVLSKRMLVATQIGKLKKEHNVSVLQTDRWKHILEDMVKLGKEKGLDREFIDKVFKTIHQESINRQEEILSEK